MGKKLLRVLLAFGVLVVLCILFCVWMVWKRPLTVDAAFSRLALKKHGFASSEIHTPDGHMTVWSAGSGQCLVLLHGAGDQAGAWARMVPGFVDEYRVVIPDLPGHWSSDPGRGPLGVGQVLAGVEAVMDTTCGGGRAVLVGNSLGAWVAMLYARDHADRVERLVAVNGGAISQLDPAVNLFPENREQARRTMAGLMGPATPPVPGFVLDDIIRHAREGPAGRLAETASEMPKYLLDNDLSSIVVPVELVWGDSDALMDMDYAERLMAGLTRSRLHPVKGCGHVPHRECPDRFAEALRTALQEQPEEAWRQELSP
jgi:pimeloyl-ACP methyl ester carboxylesterase